MDVSDATVAVGLSSGPHPGSSSVVVVEVAPHVPLSLLGLFPFPLIPSLDWSLVHVVHVVSIIP